MVQPFVASRTLTVCGRRFGLGLATSAKSASDWLFLHIEIHMLRILSPWSVLLLSASLLAQEAAGPASGAKPNAADVYHLAGLAGQAVEKGYESRQAEVPYLENKDAFVPELLEPHWREWVARSSEAMTLLAQAARIPECEFLIGKDGFERVPPDVFLIEPVVHATMVRGCQHAKDGNWLAACFDVETLLCVSRHIGKCEVYPSCILSWIFEGEALGLLGCLAESEPPPEVVVRSQRLLELHCALRVDRCLVAKALQATAAREFDVQLNWLASEEGKNSEMPQNAIKRLLENPAPTRERIMQLAKTCAAPFELGPEFPDSKMVERAAEVSNSLMEQFGKKKRSFFAELLSDPDQDVFSAMVTWSIPPVSYLADELAKSNAAIESTRRKLAAAGEVKPTPGAEKGR